MLSTGFPSTTLEMSWRASGTAAVLAIGTANPPTVVRQDEFAGWYFRVTKSQHLAALKDKTKRICDRSGIAKRNIGYIEEMIDADPTILNRALPSLGTRQGIAADAVPDLAAAAAARAIAEWSRPASDITDLVFTTSSGAQSPGADLRLATLLGLRPAVRRTMLYLQGCSAGCAAFRVAKDIAENNHGARVLVVCAEVSLLAFRAPYEARIVEIVAATLFGDGAGAAVVGAGPMHTVERPVFHMVSASQATLPGTEHAVELHVTESGLSYCISPKLPALAGSNIEQCLAEVLAPFGLAGGRDCWNGLFWAAHPGGRAILDSYEAALGLEPGKLAASRRILSEHGNMIGATIFFVLDEIRRRRRSGDV